MNEGKRSKRFRNAAKLLENFECNFLNVQLKMLVQITSGGGWVCFVLGFCVWVRCGGRADKWKEAGTALLTESRDSWQPGTRDTWHRLPPLHGTTQNKAFSTYPKEEQTHQGTVPKWDFDEER